jgi:hypothetical protein
VISEVSEVSEVSGFHLLSEMMLPKTGSGKSRVSGRAWGMVSEISEVNGFRLEFERGNELER